MRFSTSAAALFTLASFLGAQQQQQPYSEGDVGVFLEGARSNKRPAVVLFNFDHDTG